MIIRYILCFCLFCSCSSISERAVIIKYTSQPIESQLNPFSSDGCSRWPDGTVLKPNAWLECCYKHDRVYWLGGTYQQRLNSDKELKSCVKKNFANFMGILMYMGVRVGGRPNYDTSYKWGYGWKYERGYVHLTTEEYNYAQELSPYNENEIRINE